MKTGMSFLKASAGAGLVLAMMAQVARAEEVKTFKAMNYNIENLFDTVDSPDTDDAEFNAGGAQGWTEQILNDKMQNLSEVIHGENAEVLALEEIENPEILKTFVEGPLGDMGYHYVVAETQDGRGIRTALLSKFQIVNSVSHKVDCSHWIDNKGVKKCGRDLLEVTLDTGNATAGRYISVIVNHWLSKAGGPERDKWRLDEAKAMADLVADIVKNNPDRLVISLGDFNDVLSSNPFKKGLPMAPSLGKFNEAPAHMLLATDSQMSALPASQSGTHYFFPDHSWSTLDHIFTAEGADLKSGAVPGFHYDDMSVTVVHDRFVQNGGIPKGCDIPNADMGKPKRTRCTDGASDHFPITATFSLR
ncbi:MAG: endonuclease/exonuclease/phosphatase family protein [Bdellovibrionales bacterium]|nr:endonuclease/exonuclease/phosphatase family protein [Bdellovibrionales bacterium]